MHQVIIGDNRYGTPMPHKSHLIRLVDSEFVTASGSNFEGQPFFERCFDLFDSHFFYQFGRDSLLLHENQGRSENTFLCAPIGLPYY